MEFNGLPLHPLVVHATVVLTPLAALGAFLYGLVPRWRWALRWPALVINVLAAISVQIAVMSGEDLQESRGLNSPAIHTHEMWADRLRMGVFVLAVVMVVAWWALPAITALRDGHDRGARVAALDVPLRVLLVIGGLVVAYLVFRTGDAGAKAVWGSG